MHITITDDFSPDKIINCGQSFRTARMSDGGFRFIHQGHCLVLRQEAPGAFEIDADPQIWESVWRPYFDLDRNYAAIRAAVDPADSFMRKAAAEGAGIRILRQDPWEMLLSFLISQRKSIPAIRQSIELICEKWGTPIRTAEGTVFAFPSPGQLADASEDEFRACKAGYRAPYLRGAVRAVLDHILDLETLYSSDCPEILDTLMALKGVGIKVASCVALFAYGQVSAAPVDTWIGKIIDAEYAGRNPFPGYGEIAGILQQYAFYYALNHKEEYR